MGEHTKRSTIVVLADAFRNDYLHPEYTPFLWSLKDKGVYVKKLYNNGGYCERTCTMCGATPDISDNFFAMALRPFGYKKPFYEPIFNVPMELRDKLGMTEDTSVDTEPNSFGIESIWDVLRKEGKTFQFEACFALGVRSFKGRTTHGSRPIFLKDGFKKHYDYYYMQLSETDIYQHRIGAGLENMGGIVKWTDGTVEWLYEAARRELGEFNFMFFGDHGQTNIKQKIDFNLDYKGYSFGWDYLYLKSSAAIQFWTYNKDIDNVILADRKLNEYGTFIKTPTENKLGISERQASIVWRANEGVLVSPCHFHGANEELKAMHGYAPDIDSEKGMALIIDGEHKGTVEQGNLVDICSTSCDLVGVRYPEKNVGISLLKQL